MERVGTVLSTGSLAPFFWGVMCRYGYVEVEMDIVAFRVYGYTCIYTYQQQRKGPMWKGDWTDGRMS